MGACKSQIIGRLRFEDSGGFPFLLLESLTVVSNVDDLCTITVPAGFRTDLASIPKLLWSVLPPVGKYDLAAVIHDYLYQTGEINGRPVTRAQADSVLNEFMQLLHVNDRQRRIIYYGVRLGGHVAWRNYRRNG